MSRSSDQEPGTAETWLDVVDEVMDESIDREASVTLTAEDLTVDVPLEFGPDAPQARWRFDGSVTISIDGVRRPLAEWLRLWAGPPTPGVDDEDRR